MQVAKTATRCAIGLVTGGFLLFSLIGLSSTRKAKVSYPRGYRSWTHVKSMVILEGHPLYESFGGIHHVYANSPALKTLKSGKPFPDGSVLVFDLLEAKKENNAIVEGARKVIGVMEKNSKNFAKQVVGGLRHLKAILR